MKLKARSRLQPKTNLFKLESKTSDFNWIAIISKQLPFLKFDFWKTQLENRQPKIPQLIIGLIAYLISWYLVNHYYPEELKNLFWPGSYLSLIGLLGIGHLYFMSFLTLKPRFALFFSLGLSWIFWLKLHHFEINFPIVSFSLLASFGLNWFFSPRLVSLLKS